MKPPWPAYLLIDDDDDDEERTQGVVCQHVGVGPGLGSVL